MSSLSSIQKQQLDRLRQNVSDILQPLHNDSFLLRWLVARDFDLAKSEKMLRDSMKWRPLFEADKILTSWTPPPVLQKYYPGGLSGYDKEGRPIWIESTGNADVKGLMASAKKSDLIRFKIWHCELIQKAMHDQFLKLGKDVGIIVILDLENFSTKHLWKPALDFYTEVLSMYEANYPETLAKTFVINAPMIFPLAYNLVKPFLSPATKRKISILGGNWKQELLKWIDPDQLPVHWGGTATDPDGDPYCRSKIVLGGTVDQSFYIPDNGCMDSAAITKVVVKTRATLKLPFHVKEPGSLLRWQFMTETSDIGFGICYKASDDGDGEGEVVVPSTRLNSHLVPEDGSIACKRPGFYVVMFDNSYSWVTSKSLLYQVDVLAPDENIDELKTSAS